MILDFDLSLVKKYKSESQRIRVLTEEWLKNEGFCPNCGSKINKYPANKPVKDFYCPICKENYELKSKKNNLGNKIVDGAYNTMIASLNSDTNSSFFFLNYQNYKIKNLLVIPKSFFVIDMIEERKPLSIKAKRPNWIGCNILLDKIPNSGKIFYIKNGITLAKDEIMNNFQKVSFLKEERKNLKGWTLDVMSCIDELNKEDFTLDEIYSFEKKLRVKYPDNKHIKDKIRQQLQYLRDKGYLEFIGNGKYKIV